MDHERLERRVRGLRRDLLGELRGQPRRERQEARIARGIGERDLIGHEAALREARERDLRAVDRILLARVVDEDLEQALRHPDRGEVGRLARRDREPAVADHARPGLDRDRALRTQHQRAAAVQHRREPDQIVRGGTPAVQQEDGRERAVAGRHVRGVEQLHRSAA